MMLNKIFHLILLSLIPIFGFSQVVKNSQYPDSGNKIRLGFQTTGDGLIWRDTQPKVGGYQPINNKAAWIILDTINNKFYHYKDSTWTLAGGQDIDTASMLGNYWRSSRFSGVLPVANGGTGQSTLTANKVMVGNTTSGVLTPPNLHWDNTNSRLGVGMSSPTVKLDVSGNFRVLNPNATTQFLFESSSNSYESGLYFVEGGSIKWGWTKGSTTPNLYLYGNGSSKYVWHLKHSNGFFGININPEISETPTEQLDVGGNARIRAVTAGTFANNLNITSDGTLTTATSDEKYKYNILPISYGLNTILQLKPVNFQWIKGEENDLGFIAQDVAEIIPEAVNTNWNSDLLMRYESIIPILTKAIQEQNVLIKALEQRILILENK